MMPEEGSVEFWRDRALRAEAELRERPRRSTSLTRRQLQLKTFIINYMQVNHGLAPSLDEMRVQLGLSSKSGVCRMLNGLEERRHLRRLKGRARAIELLT